MNNTEQVSICDGNNKLNYTSHDVMNDPGYDDSLTDSSTSTNKGNSELALIILGKNFTTTDGVEVNKTYEAWIANLNKLVNYRQISRYVANSVILLNWFDRKPTNEDGSEEDSDKECDLPKYFHPPYVI